MPGSGGSLRPDGPSTRRVAIGRTKTEAQRGATVTKMIGNIGRWSKVADDHHLSHPSHPQPEMPVPSTSSSSSRQQSLDDPPPSSSSSPFKALSSLRRIPSRLATAFSLGGNKKRKASPSPPPKKRARIAAPDTLGSEESRQLIALLDSPSQPDYIHRKMLEDLERSRAEERELQRGAALSGQMSDGSEDDDEVECSLTLDPEDGKGDQDVRASGKADKGKARAIEGGDGHISTTRLGKGKAKVAPQLDSSHMPTGSSSHHESATNVHPSPTHINGAQNAHPKIPSESSDQTDINIDIANVQQPTSSATFPAGDSKEQEDRPDDRPLSDQEEQLLIRDIHNGESSLLEVPTPGSEQRDMLPGEDANQSSAAEALQAQGQEIGDNLPASTGEGSLVFGDAQKHEAANTSTMDMTKQETEAASVVNGQLEASDRAGHNRTSIDGQQQTQTAQAEGPVRPSDSARTWPVLTNGSAVNGSAKALARESLPDLAPIEGDESNPPLAFLDGGLYPALPQPLIAVLPEPTEVAADGATEVEAVQQPDEFTAPIVTPAASDHPDSADALTEDVLPLEVDMLEGERAGVDAAEEGTSSPNAAGEKGALVGKDESVITNVPKGDHKEAPLPAVAHHTNEVGEEEDIAGDDGLIDDSRANPDGEGEDVVEQPGLASGAPVLVSLESSQPIEVIDFTAEDSDDTQEDIVIPAPGANSNHPPASAPFIRKPSSGLLRGPLLKAASDQKAATSSSSRIPIPSRHAGDASSLIRQMGRASLASPSPARAAGSSVHGGDASSVSMRDVFANQRYQRPQSKRRSILHHEHKAKIRAKNQRGMAALKMFFQQNATSLRRAGFDDPVSLDSYLHYAEIIYQGGADTAPPKSRANAFEALANRDSIRQHQLRLLLGKSRATQSRIAIKPGKEQRRLRREQQLKERRRRGVLGRPQLPLQLEPAQEDAVRAILDDRSWKSSIPGASATHHDIVKLRPGTWMNDETITFYMTMLNQRAQQAEAERAKPSYDKRKWDAFYRVHAFNSHFWAKLESSGYSSVSRWTRKVNIFAKDLILIPCNLGNSHWTCAVINFRLKLFEYYDSMGHRNSRVLSYLREYVKKEMADKKRDGVVDLNEFRDYYGRDTSPQQRNSFDCGVFVCATLEQLSRRDSHYPFNEEPPPLDPLDPDEDDHNGDGALARDGYDWNFSQKDMPYMRKRIIFEISQKSLLD